MGKGWHEIKIEIGRERERQIEKEREIGGQGKE